MYKIDGYILLGESLIINCRDELRWSSRICWLCYNGRGYC